MRFTAAAALLLFFSVYEAGCLPAALVLGERAVLDCSRGPYDELYDRSFRLTRRQGFRSESLAFTMRIRKNCVLDLSPNIVSLGIVSLYIDNPRQSGAATLVLVTDRKTSTGGDILCSAPFREDEEMRLSCAPEAGELSFELSPAEDS